MKKSTIVQFVCFVTSLQAEEFAPKWERYASKLLHSPESALQQQVGTKTKYQYLSQHEWQDQDFLFSFMNETRSEHFPEHNVKVVQMGGYTLLQTSARKLNKEAGTKKLIAFVSHEEYDLNYYLALPGYTKLNIYQPYYESCLFGYVLEFFTPDNDLHNLSRELKERKGVEVGTYKEYMVAQLL